MIVKHLNENLTVRITYLFPIFHLVFTYKNKAWTNNKCFYGNVVINGIITQFVYRCMHIPLLRTYLNIMLISTCFS